MSIILLLFIIVTYVIVFLLYRFENMELQMAKIVPVHTIKEENVKNFLEVNPVKRAKMKDITGKHFLTYVTINEKYIPEILDENIKSFKNDLTFGEYAFFDNDDCAKFIENYFPPKICKAYTKLKPEAFRCDLWRLCVLYQFGGLYTDISLSRESNLSSFEEYDFVLCEDLKKPDIFNAVLYFKKPKHEFLHFCIENISNDILNERYGNSYLDITGPAALGRLFSKFYNHTPSHGKNKIGTQNFLFLRMKTKINILGEKNLWIELHDKILLKRHPKYNKVRNFFTRLQKTNKYYDLWNQKKVYHD